MSRNGSALLMSLALLSLVLVTGSPLAAQDEFAYVGVKNCKKCHLKQWKSWSQTSMAQAYDNLGTLRFQSFAADPREEEILDCHRDAAGWFRKSLDVFEKMEAISSLNHYQSSLKDGVARKFEVVEEALGKLQDAGS